MVKIFGSDEEEQVRTLTDLLRNSSEEQINDLMSRLTQAISHLAEGRELGRAGGSTTPAGADRAVVAEWTARLALSLMATPSLTVGADDPDALRRFVAQLFALGLGQRVGNQKRKAARRNQPR